MGNDTIPKLRSVLFGYNRREVDSYVRGLLSDYAARLSEADARTGRMRSETRRLEQEVLFMKSQIEAFRVKEPFILRLEREAEYTRLAMTEMARKRVSAIVESVESEVLVHRAEARRVSQEIDRLRAQYIGYVDTVDQAVRDIAVDADVSFEQRTIRVARTMHRLHGAWVVTEPKTRGSVRAILLPPLVR